MSLHSGWLKSWVARDGILAGRERTSGLMQTGSLFCCPDLEVALLFALMRNDSPLCFKKSSSSDSSRNMRCVEVAFAEDGVHVRNSKIRSNVVKFTFAEWEAFLDGVKRGEFDLAQK